MSTSNWKLDVSKIYEHTKKELIDLSSVISLSIDTSEKSEAQKDTNRSTVVKIRTN